MRPGSRAFAAEGREHHRFDVRRHVRARTRLIRPGRVPPEHLDRLPIPRGAFDRIPPSIGRCTLTEAPAKKRSIAAPDRIEHHGRQ
ncbi:MAG: hypothetical protein KF817_05630 [Phycisphaeraceae bacterium]|nr:hypothetical protein [Phycisphaeraceae bacterium]